MDKVTRIAAFGALNDDSYVAFREQVARFAKGKGIAVEVVCAGPYPNKEAVSEAARPLRAEALQDPEKKKLLVTAVAADGRGAGADTADIRCMPCMSMVGFHDDVEKTLGKNIVRLADAMKAHFKGINKVGVIHMRPAKQRIIEIFGEQAVVPDEAQASKLLAAEEAAKKTGNTAPVEAVMKEITETWRDQGIKHVLFARADAPLAHKGPAGQVPGVTITSTFEVLAAYLFFINYLI